MKLPSPLVKDIENQNFINFLFFVKKRLINTRYKDDLEKLLKNNEFNNIQKSYQLEEI